MDLGFALVFDPCNSFAVLNYIKNGVYMRTDYIGMLQKMFEKPKIGGKENNEK